MDFLNYNYLWALPAVAALVLLLWIYGDFKRRQAVREYAAGGAECVISYTKRFYRRLLLMIAMLLLVLAAARPHWGVRPLDLNLSGADVLVIFDVSKSMLAEDVTPSRLEHGKWLFRELIGQHQDTAFGVVAFAGRAFPYCPITTDRVSLEQCIDELDCSTVPIGGTNLAAALTAAVKLLKASSGTAREIILITDGEELAGSAGRELEELKKNNIRLLIAGIGDPNIPALIPEVNAEGQKHFKRDNSGDLVKTKLNEELLRNIASETGGIYVNSSTANPNLASLSAALNRDRKLAEKQIRRSLPIERFGYFLFFGVIGVALYLFINEKGFWRRNILILLGSGGLFMSDLTASDLPIMTAAEEQQVNLPAAAEEESLQLPERANAFQIYNLARDLQLNDKDAEARELYQKLNVPQTPWVVRRSSLHNLGVLEHRASRMQFAKSVESFQKGELDQALKNLDEADKKLDSAEEFYVSVFKMPSAGNMNKITASAQQNLLNDRLEIEKFRKKIEDLKKARQQAQEKIQQAKDKNQQQQKSQSDPQQSRQQNQDSQQSPPQKQDEQQQKKQNDSSQSSQQEQSGQQQSQSAQQEQSGQPSDSADEALKKAQKAVDDLQKKSESMAQKKLSEQAAQAAENLKSAAEKQQKGNYSGAAEDIEKASQALGTPESDQQQNKSDKQSEGNGKSEKNTDDDAQKKDDSRDHKGSEEKNRPDNADQSENKMDQNQADALLDLMGQDEKILRDAMRNYRNRRVAPVEKDW